MSLIARWRAHLEYRIQQSWANQGWGSHLLLPLAGLYGGLVAARRYAYAKGWLRVVSLPVPVVVVGNAVVGGSGKTPTVLCLLQWLCEAGWQPGVISRGYGVHIDPQRAAMGKGAEADPTKVGDEAAMLAQHYGVAVAAHPDRVLAARSLLAAYPDINVLLSDDGLQHFRLGRDLDIALVDERSLDQARLLPAGPLREPLQDLQRADAIVTRPGLSLPAFLHDIKRFDSCLQLVQAVHLQSGECVKISSLASDARFARQPCLAAAGIARPARFFDALQAAGLHCVLLALPDHFSYAYNPFTECPEAHIFITAKDAIKCARFNDPRLWRIDAELKIDAECRGWFLTQLEAVSKRITVPSSSLV